MIRHRLLGIAAGCLLFLAGPVFAEPVADTYVPSTPAERGEVWGDPEESEEPAGGWTWFGMGYERRNRDTDSQVVTPSDKTDDSNGNGGKGK